ncbi:MAG TPA: hypothetical protein VK843_12195 [Planctomycetota bacterium]|nr:hypothetical protein [Planctomycetota bacterium]
MGSLWFLSTYLGAIIGLVLLSRAGALWNELGLGSQVWLGGLVMFTVCIVYGAAAIVPLRLFEASAGLPAASFWLCAGHWAALATCIQRSGWSVAAKLIAMTCLGWWMPALLDGAAGWERLRWALAPQRHLDVGGQSIETSLGVLVDTIPVVAWWVAAALLPTRSAFKR